MNKKMGKRVIVTLMAVMLLMATSVTSFAKTDRNENVEGNLVKWASAGARAYTHTRKDGQNKVYVSLSVEYMSTVGNMYTSSPVTNTDTDGAVTATYTPVGSFVSAWSHHGVTGKEFTIYI